MLLGGVIVSHACGQCSFAGSSLGKTLTYSFEPLVENGKLIVHVTLGFRGGPEGSMELVLPSNWAEQSHLEKQVRNFRALSSDTIVLDTALPSVKTLQFHPNQSVAISYELTKGWDGPFVHPKQFLGVFEPTHFEFTTQNALVHPKLNPTEVVSAHFDWQKLPAGWTLETSFGADDRCQEFTGLWDKVENALFAAGDFRVHRSAVEGQPLVVAIRGKWSFTDEEFVAQISRIVKAEREFWHDNDFPYYLVTLSPYDVQSGGSDGSGFTNAFWLFNPWGEALSYELHYHLAHEGFHTWNPYKIGIVKEPGARVKWATEGFTVYYGDILLLRAGLLPLPEYIAKLNKRIFDYESLPLKNLTNEELEARYDERSVNQLPYARGPVLALWLDAQIRKQSKGKSSLDRVLLTLASEATKNPAVELTSERVLRAAGKELNRKSRKQLANILENGESIPIPDFPKNPCVGLESEKLPLFDLGFDGDVLLSKNLVVNVQEDSEAFKAGVRDGQEVLGMSVTWNDENESVRLRVRTASGQKRIEYFPKGKTVSVPQYSVSKEVWISTPKKCTFPPT
jgi:predicted metalloprotease with PDZ domain